jgi:hypothetical protein
MQHSKPKEWIEHTDMTYFSRKGATAALKLKREKGVECNGLSYSMAQRNGMEMEY